MNTEKGGNPCKKEFPPLHVWMIIRILTREDTLDAVCVCVCVCVYTNLTHIQIFNMLFERRYRYMHDAADNSMLPEHIIIFPQTDCKSECIFIY